MNAGEWIGTTTAFDYPSGRPQALPERYVPPEFNKWNLTLKAWSTASSMKVDAGVLHITTKYMLPTVGAGPGNFLLSVQAWHHGFSSICTGAQECVVQAYALPRFICGRNMPNPFRTAHLHWPANVHLHLALHATSCSRVDVCTCKLHKLVWSCTIGWYFAS